MTHQIIDGTLIQFEPCILAVGSRITGILRQKIGVSGFVIVVPNIIFTRLVIHDSTTAGVRVGVVVLPNVHKTGVYVSVAS